MNRLSLTLILLIVTVILFACDDKSTDAPIVTIEDYDEAQYLTVWEPGVRIFTDSTQWLNFYDRFGNGREHAPDVDFDNVTLIGVFWVLPQGCDDDVDCLDVIFVTPEFVFIYVDTLPDLGECASPVTPRQILQANRPNMNARFSGHVP